MQFPSLRSIIGPIIAFDSLVWCELLNFGLWNLAFENPETSLYVSWCINILIY